jgi:hypothetical protein
MTVVTTEPVASDILETAVVEPPPSVVSEAVVATSVDDTSGVNPLGRSSQANVTASDRTLVSHNIVRQSEDANPDDSSRETAFNADGQETSPANSFPITPASAYPRRKFLSGPTLFPTKNSGKRNEEKRLCTRPKSCDQL